MRRINPIVRLLLVVIFAPLFAGASVVQAPQGKAEDIVFEKPVAIGMGKAQYYRGEFAALDKYTPFGMKMPVAYLTPSDTFFNPARPARIVVYLHPDDGGHGHFISGGWTLSSNNVVEIRNQEDSYSTNPGASWWGYSGGQVGKTANYNGERIAASIDYVLERHPGSIDLNKGLILKGASLGGTGIILQSMILPRYQKHVAIVDATIANMLIIKCCRKMIAKAWRGADFESVDFRRQLEKVENIHYHWKGGSNDSLGRFDIEFFKLCEASKISCSGVWLNSGHGVSEKGVNLPTALFLDAKQDVTLDRILPVITNSTANYHGDLRGHHNRSISWDHSGIIDTQRHIKIPLKYKALRNVGGGIPDQPATVEFSLTPRHVMNFNLQAGADVDWTFGAQAGKTAVGDDGLLTIDNLLLDSSDTYTTLVLSR